MVTCLFFKSKFCFPICVVCRIRDILCEAVVVVFVFSNHTFHSGKVVAKSTQLSATFFVFLTEYVVKFVCF